MSTLSESGTDGSARMTPASHAPNSDKTSTRYEMLSDTLWETLGTDYLTGVSAYDDEDDEQAPNDG